MQHQRKLSTATNHSFNKSTGTECNEVKKLIIVQFSKEGVEGACLESQANQMNECLCWVNVLLYYLDKNIKRCIELMVSRCQ